MTVAAIVGWFWVTCGLFAGAQLIVGELRLLTSLVAGLLAGLVAVGVVAGVLCWRRGHRVAGLVGMVAPALPVATHYLTLAIDRTEAWAPTMVGDLVGIGAAISASVVALVGLSSPDRRGATP